MIVMRLIVIIEEFRKTNNIGMVIRHMEGGFDSAQSPSQSVHEVNLI